MPSEYLTKNEIDAALLVRMDEFNAQQQPRMSWPAATVVARAYLDQLNRSQGHLGGERRRGEVGAGQGRQDQAGPNSKAALDSIDARRHERRGRRRSARGRDAMRLKALAATMKGRTAALR